MERTKQWRSAGGKLKDFADESEDLSEEQENFKEKILFAKDEFFSKDIHRKHVKKDITALNVLTNTIIFS